MNLHLSPKIKGKLITCPTCRQSVTLIEDDTDLSKKDNRIFRCSYCDIGFWVWD